MNVIRSNKSGTIQLCYDDELVNDPYTPSLIRRFYVSEHGAVHYYSDDLKHALEEYKLFLLEELS